MKTLVGTLVLLTSLSSIAATALPQEATRTRPPAEAQDPEPAKPVEPEPKGPPPPPPAELPKPPAEAPKAAPSRQENQGGQWVYTEQYGWVWMPYGDRFVHTPPDGSTPNMYVYYPEAGWCWVVAPWLWGWGPSPYFGLLGPRYYGWWGIGFGHWYGFRGHYGYERWSGPHYWSGGRWTPRSGYRGFGGGVRR